MKAIVCTRYGKTEAVVALADRPVPEVRPSDVLVEIHAASVNPIDYKLHQGSMKAIRKFEFPLTLGYDLSGVIKQVGSAVQNFKVGDEVFSRVDTFRFGTFAEYIAVDEKYLAAKPANVSHQQAAAVPLVALTTWQALVTTAQLQVGQKVLIHAGAGGIGSIAIQIAKALGAYVITTTSTKNVDFVTSLGADQVIDYTQQSFDQVCKDVDVVFETLGGDNQTKSFQVLKPGGILVSIVGIPSPQWARDEGLPFFMPWLFGIMNRKNNALARKHKARFEPVMLQPDGKHLALIGQLITDGKLKPVIDKVFPLEDTAKALLYSQSGRAKGKIVIGVK